MSFHPHATKTRQRRWNVTSFFSVTSQVRWHFFLYTSPDMSFHPHETTNSTSQVRCHFFFCYISSEMTPFLIHITWDVISPTTRQELDISGEISLLFFLLHLRWDVTSFFSVTSQVRCHLLFFFFMHIKWDVAFFFFFYTPHLSCHFTHARQELNISGEMSLLFFCYISSEMTPFFYTSHLRCHFTHTRPKQDNAGEMSLPFFLLHLKWDDTFFYTPHLICHFTHTRPRTRHRRWDATFFSVTSQVRWHLFWYISPEMSFHPQRDKN